MKKYLILIFVALAAVFQSCDNNDDLWDAIDDLKSPCRRSKRRSTR